MEKFMKRNKMKSITAIYELTPIFDGRKSFYGKAFVHQDNYGGSTLQSYDTKIIHVSRDKEITLLSDRLSKTTMRHVKEFLRQLELEEVATLKAEQLIENYMG